MEHEQPVLRVVLIALKLRPLRRNRRLQVQVHRSAQAFRLLRLRVPTLYLRILGLQASSLS